MLTQSELLDKNLNAPNFVLLNTDNKYYSLKDIKGSKGTLICFICNHCPYVKAVIHKIVKDTQELKKYGIGSVAIMSNDIDSYPEDSFENMIKFSKDNNFSIPYLYDETQNIAKSYKALCTPDFFGFDKNLRLQFRGRIDSSGFQNKENVERELFNSMIAVSNNIKIPFNNPSIGCSIKWKQNAG